MGVSGSGKSTIGKLLSESLHIPFFDGDDFHPMANVEKMKSGQPLNDDDRKPWLETLADLIRNKKELILACSALKKSYRDILSEGNEITYVHLKGSAQQIAERMSKRKSHFMPTQLLKSQFSTLEIPENAIAVDISMSPKEIVSSVLERITS